MTARIVTVIAAIGTVIARMTARIVTARMTAIGAGGTTDEMTRRKVVEIGIAVGMTESVIVPRAVTVMTERSQNTMTNESRNRRLHLCTYRGAQHQVSGGDLNGLDCCVPAFTWQDLEAKD